MESAKVVTDIEFAKKWRVLYPLYIDKSVGRDQGRKVKASMAVDMPDIDDFRQIFSFLKIPHVLEVDKNHPRDFFCKGRVRYNLTTETGAFINPEVKNSRPILRQSMMSFINYAS